MNGAARLRALLDAGCVPVPGAFNGLCARAIARAGFQACYVSGAATSACLGVPDVGLVESEHFCRVIREVVRASGLPVIADADTGFGEADTVRRTVIEYARAGAAAIHIEDQAFPKRCGHLEGKRLIATDHMCEKIVWAVRAARDLSQAATGSPSAAPAIIVCARTDARSVEGFDAAIRRACEYVRAGAEMIFPEGLESESEFEQFAQAIRADTGSAGGRSRRPYLLANMTEFGTTPQIPLVRFAALGYSCVLYPVTLLRLAMGAIVPALERLRTEGSAAGLLNQMQTRQQLYDLLEYRPGVPWDWPPR